MRWVGAAWVLGWTVLQAGSPGRDYPYFFRSNCAACHGVDGTAKGPGGVRLPGRSLAEAAKEKDETLVRIIHEGKGAMPTYKGKLSLEDSQRIVSDIILPLARKGIRTRGRRLAK